MYPLCDSPQTFRSMIARVHGRHIRQQRLCGANIARGFLAANMLFARLQRQPQGRAPARILRYPHDPSGHMSFESIARRQESGMRPAIAQWNAKALRAADRYICPEFPRRSQQS